MGDSTAEQSMSISDDQPLVDAQGRYCLDEDEVHLWWFDLDLASVELTKIEKLLSQDEVERAARFRTEKLRNRYVAGRGMVRNVLGRYLGKGPELISFSYGPHGKPALCNGRQLEFNLSHSANKAILAVARQPVGVDLELIRTDLDVDGMASLVFTNEEQAKLTTAVDEERFRYFFTNWVRKEAFMKATGRGISETPSRFRVVAKDSGLCIKRIDEYEAIPLCRVFDLRGDDSTVAALALCHLNNLRLRYFTVLKD